MRMRMALAVDRVPEHLAAAAPLLAAVLGHDRRSSFSLSLSLSLSLLSLSLSLSISRSLSIYLSICSRFSLHSGLLALDQRCNERGNFDERLVLDASVLDAPGTRTLNTAGAAGAGGARAGGLGSIPRPWGGAPQLSANTLPTVPGGTLSALGLGEPLGRGCPKSR